MRVLETDIETEVCKDAMNLHGVHSLKFTPQGQVGWPDRQFLIHGGRPLFIEFKLPGEDLEPIQAYRHGLLRALNYDVEVCDNYVDAMAYIIEALERGRRG